MKYIVILGDGMADRPLDELGGKTPLGAACKPNMDRFAREGVCGVTRTLRDGMPTGSDVANLSVLGYKPELYYTGRSPIEALGCGIEVGERDMVFRANLVNIAGDGMLPDCTMIDHSSDKITDGEAAELVKALAGAFGDDIDLYPGASYRNILIWRNFLDKFDGKPTLAPPHDILTQSIAKYMPSGDGAKRITAITELSREILRDHPVNLARVERGLRSANCLWLWGEGTRPKLDNFFERYGLHGAMVTAVPLLEGLAVGMGMKNIKVPGVTGDINTNYEGKANAAVDALKDGADLAFVHVEAPDECGHDGQIEEKKLSIEYIDRRVIGVILSRLPELGDEEVRFLLMPDHATPICKRTHTVDLVPFAIWSNKRHFGPGAESYTEKSALETGFRIEEGPELMSYFIKL